MQITSREDLHAVFKKGNELIEMFAYNLAMQHTFATITKEMARHRQQQLNKSYYAAAPGAHKF